MRHVGRHTIAIRDRRLRGLAPLRGAAETSTWLGSRGFSPGARPLRPPGALRPPRLRLGGPTPRALRSTPSSLHFAREPPLANARLAPGLAPGAAPSPQRCGSAARGAVRSRDAICLTPNCAVRSTRTDSNAVRTDSSLSTAIRWDAPHMLESCRNRPHRARIPSNVDTGPSVWAPTKKSRTSSLAQKRAPRRANSSHITNSFARCGSAAGHTKKSPPHCAMNLT